jgi:hypothetical protein
MESDRPTGSDRRGPSPLAREEYVEQAYLFRTLADRLQQNVPIQELLTATRDELLSSTRLPLAVDVLAGELRHRGVFAPAMAKLPHYFSPFQTYLIEEAESERGRFDFRVALKILEREATYRSEGCGRQGLFLFQFEALCRNRLSYDRGLGAMAGDPTYDASWQEWILKVRYQVGIVDFADLIYLRSEHYQRQHPVDDDSNRSATSGVALFGEKEGKIALANRRKDPLFLFSSLQRHLGYPEVPRPKPPDESQTMLPNLRHRMERVESRLRLLEEEQRGGIDLARFYRPPGE